MEYWEAAIVLLVLTIIICCIVSWLLYFIVDEEHKDVRDVCLAIAIVTTCLLMCLFCGVSGC